MRAGASSALEETGDPFSGLVRPRLWEAFPVTVGPGARLLQEGDGQEPRWLIVGSIYHSKVLIFLPQWVMELGFTKAKWCPCGDPTILGPWASEAAADTLMGSGPPRALGEAIILFMSGFSLSGIHLPSQHPEGALMFAESSRTEILSLSELEGRILG